MELPDAIKQAAEDLGKRLGAEAGVQNYLDLQNQVQQDADVVSLEYKHDQFYQRLARRQKNGEPLDHSELDEYYALKRQVQDHPLVDARDTQLEGVKALFGKATQRITSILGIDYPTFAR
jgi:cell fate (sporulation/competence/biofilm development) regulator YlbF (YheA/YmcA/DUF963 family)